MSRLLLSMILSATASSAEMAWTFSDGPNRTFSGTFTGTDKPLIVCHIDICDSLWSMGVREDQMIGYFGGDVTSWDSICHGTHCMTAHFEVMTSVNTPGSTYGIDLDKLNALAPDVIVDAAYGCMNGGCEASSCGVRGLLQYTIYGGASVADLCAGPWQIITIDVMQGYIEVVDAIQRLAMAMGDAPNPDTVEHCEQFHEAMTAMQTSAQRLQEEGMRVTTISLAATMIYAAQPTDDPILIMLEELGVPMTHVNVSDNRGYYWEWITFNSSATGAAQTTTAGGYSIYPTDIWLYDARSHDSVMEAFQVSPQAQFDNPAWVAGQIAPWPIDSTWTYERGTRILNVLRAVFDAAVRIEEPPGTCTDVADVTLREVLAPGEFACYNPNPTFPSCPAAGSENPPPEWQAAATAAGWVPCGQASRARKRKLALLERERKRKLLEERGPSQALSKLQARKDKASTDDDDEL